MKIKCPKCKENAELTPDFSLITCTQLQFGNELWGNMLDILHILIRTYSDILGDYAGSTEGQTSGSLDEWD